MSMTPENRLDIDVEVLIHGSWYAGTLEHRRRHLDDWQGFVRYSTGVGQNHIGWFDYAALRTI